ncbi:MAG: hypothetical protein ACTHLT_15885 [Devosia sp.]
MRRVWRELVELWRVLVLGAFIAGLLLSPNVAAAVKVAGLAADGAYAEIHLQSIPPERYAEEIAAALEAHDATLARSLAALAASRDIAIPTELTERIASLPAVDLGATLGAGWNCVVNGDFDSEAGFACVVATDMTGIGDVRDLVGEGGKFIAGQPVDYFTLGIASVGLGLSAATYSSLGAALPLRVGSSFVKAMHRVGKLPPRLTAQIARALERGINRPALEEAIGLATSLRLAELGRPLSRLFNPRSVRLASNLAEDFGTIGKAGGVRAMKLSLEAADSTADVRRLARVADSYGERFVGVMKLVGRGALRLGHLLFTIVGWLVGAALWAWSMVTFTLNAITSTDRFFRRRARARRRNSKESFRNRSDAVHLRGARRRSSAFIRVAESRMKSGSSVAVTPAQ